VNAKGQFVAVDWLAVIFNPSLPYRLVHMVLAAYLTTAFVVGAVGALHLLRDPRNAAARLMFSMAMGMATVVAPMQIAAGDAHGVNTLQYQPAKIAALEGDFETRSGAPLILFGLPNMQTERTDYAVEIPRLGSLILTHSWNGTITGLKAWPATQRPYSPLVFWSFRVMVGIGLSALARRALRFPVAASGRIAHGAVRIHRSFGRMGHDGGGTPALHGLRPAANGRFGLPDRCARGRRVAGGVRRRLLRSLRSGRVLHPAAHERSAART
jgi:cytochrome d ubiquinol oxidase subunit I